MILAGDIGGTKTCLALFKGRPGSLALVAEETFASREFAGLGAIARRFLSSRGKARVDRACFGVAGPVKEGRSRTTNLPWVVDASRLARELAIPSVIVINDLEASAHGIAELRPSDLAVLARGARGRDGHAAIISAGTGLGEAGLIWDGRRHRPVASEGGHASFAPGSDLEMELLRHLRGRYGHVSWERVLSGPGLHNIYLFLRDTERGAEPAWLAEEVRRGDPAAVISLAALEGRSQLCSDALDLFVGLYGAEAGNLALKMMATAGVYLGGGIAPKILQRLKGQQFLRAFV
ncbi:MAG: glucokinase, partial [Acidobacteriota bacterium]